MRAVVLLVLVMGACSSHSSPTATTDLQTGPPTHACRAAFDSSDPTQLLPTLTQCDSLDGWIAGLQTSGTARTLDIASRKDAERALANLCFQADKAVQDRPVCKTVAGLPPP